MAGLLALLTSGLSLLLALLLAALPLLLPALALLLAVLIGLALLALFRLALLRLIRLGKLLSRFSWAGPRWHDAGLGCSLWLVAVAALATIRSDLRHRSDCLRPVDSVAMGLPDGLPAQGAGGLAWLGTSL
jgi:hypothetical protein